MNIKTEIARDHHLASQAAESIAEGTPLDEIEMAELEALADWITQEIWDRPAR